MGTLVALLVLSLATPIAALSAAPPAEVEAVLPAAVALRHDLHRAPELSNREFKTAERIATELRALGLEVRTGIARTGVVGVLRGARPGPVVAVRADIDALPVTEATDLPFRSTVRVSHLGQEVGVAHACGHDIHTAIGFGTAALLARQRATLAGTVLFVFQPAEEGPPAGEEGGAALMLEEGVFADPRPQAIFALHTWPDLAVGELGTSSGAVFAAADEFRATLHGKQAHGAAPHLAVDPVVIAAQAVLALQTIRSRSLDPYEPSVVTVGIVRGGERLNIIPAEVHLEGTIRTFDRATQELAHRRLREILDGVTRAGGGSFDLELRSNAPATVNDADLARRAIAWLEAEFGKEAVREQRPAMVSEDFAYFAQAIPGFYFRLGTTAPGTVSGGLHTPTYRGDDGAIAVGIRAMTALVTSYLGR